jgi:uncharacterized FlgJ-related protein
MAKHETSNFSSELATKYNNFFGMGFPRDRKAINTGRTDRKVEGQYMSVYKDLNQSVKDFLLWLDYNKFPANLSSPEDFVRVLKDKGYFVDSAYNYFNGVKRWL